MTVLAQGSIAPDSGHLHESRSMPPVDQPFPRSENIMPTPPMPNGFCRVAALFSACARVPHVLGSFDLAIPFLPGAALYGSFVTLPPLPWPNCCCQATQIWRSASDDRVMHDAS